MTAVDDFFRSNENYAQSFALGHLATAPAKHLAIVTCMDSRIDLFAALGLELGEAHLIRNAGGIVTDDVIRSLMISQRLLGTREIAIIQHTKCGLMSFTDDKLKAELEAETGVKPPFALEAFTDLDVNLRQSMARIRLSPFLVDKEHVRGFVYDVATGRLREVA
jgi:carbonic anhydrase